MALSEINKRINGKKDCSFCEGTGWELFHGTKILCHECNSESSIGAYWNSVDGYLARNL